MKTKNWFMPMSLSLLLTASGLAQAQSGRSALPESRKALTMSEMKPHIGLRAGIADVDQRYETTTDYGLDVGFQPYIPYSVTVSLSQFSTDRTTLGAASGGMTRTKLLAQGAYNFTGANNFIRHSYLGLAIGPVLDRTNGEDAVNFGWAPTAGFDFPINRREENNFFTLGAVAQYLVVGGGRPSTLALNGAVKYWF